MKFCSFETTDDTLLSLSGLSTLAYGAQVRPSHFRLETRNPALSNPNPNPRPLNRTYDLMNTDLPRRSRSRPHFLQILERRIERITQPLTHPPFVSQPYRCWARPASSRSSTSRITLPIPSSGSSGTSSSHYFLVTISIAR